jgi:hypothetical protein
MFRRTGVQHFFGRNVAAAGSHYFTPKNAKKGMWGKVHFGNVFMGMRNAPFMYPRYRNQLFSMKKHRYTKRWKFRRYKIAALANVPFSKKLRVGMLPKLAGSADDTMMGTMKDFDAFSDALKNRVMAKAEATKSSDALDDSPAAGGKKKKGLQYPKSSSTATPHTPSRFSKVTPGRWKVISKYLV